MIAKMYQAMLIAEQEQSVVAIYGSCHKYAKENALESIVYFAAQLKGTYQSYQIQETVL